MLFFNIFVGSEASVFLFPPKLSHVNLPCRWLQGAGAMYGTYICDAFEHGKLQEMKYWAEKKITKKCDNVCIYEQKVVPLRKIMNITNNETTSVA